MSAQLSVHHPTDAIAESLNKHAVTLDIHEKTQDHSSAIILFIGKDADGLAFARKLVVAATNAVALIQDDA